MEHEEQKAKASIELVTADLVKLAVKKLIPKKQMFLEISPLTV